MRHRINVRKYSDPNRPNLKFVVSYREAGKRKRSFFETEKPAKSFAALKNAERHRHGVEHAEISTTLRIAAKNAFEALSPLGKTIDDAVQHYLAYLKASEGSITAGELVTEIIAAKKADGMSARYVQDLRSRLPRFSQAFDGRKVATITTSEIDQWLRSLSVGPTTRNNFRRVLVTFFSYAAAHGYATENPALKAAKATERDESPGILTVQQTADLLEAADRELLPYVAIGAFAGLRRAELERLDWSDIHFDDNLIEVTAKKSKTASRRFVKIQPNLREWLWPARKHAGKVTPSNFEKRLSLARAAAGIEQWPDNGLRHSFASYHLAHFRDAAALALEMGHTDSGMTFRHYRQLVKPKAGNRYWQIKPKPGTDRKVVQVEPGAFTAAAR